MVALPCPDVVACAWSPGGTTVLGMSTALLERETGTSTRLPTSAELREMSDEEVATGSRRNRINHPANRRAVPTREQNPYLGESLRRAKFRTGRELWPRRMEMGILVSTRTPDAAKVVATYPGFPSNRLWVLQEIMEIMALNYKGNADRVEEIMSDEFYRHRLDAIAEGREDDVYRELWFGGYNP